MKMNASTQASTLCPIHTDDADATQLSRRRCEHTRRQSWPSLQFSVLISDDIMSDVIVEQESLADARVAQDSAVIPTWPSAAIFDFIETVIAPFDPPTPKTFAKKQTWRGSDAPFASHSPLNYTVTLKMRFGVTQGHRKRHYSIEHIRLYIYSSLITKMVDTDTT